MDAVITPQWGGIQWLGLLIVLVANTLGMTVTLRHATVVRGLLLVAISLLLVGTGEHSLLANPSLPGYLSLTGGMAFGFFFPCTGGGSADRSLTLLRSAAFAVVIAHGMLDGHVLREMNGAWLLLALLFLHKLLDGADARLLFDRTSTSLRWLVGIVTLGATPLGYFAIPEASVNQTLHHLLFAGIIGFNMGSAMHIFRESRAPSSIAPVPTVIEQP